MLDLYFASALILALAAVLAAASAWLAKKSRVAACVLVTLAVAALALHVGYGRHSLWPVKFLPYSAMMILADPQPLLIAIVAGAGARLMPGHAARRAVLLAPLVALCLWTSFGALFARTPETGDRWEGRVCMQTFESSCAPAAGATLLRAHGIVTGETEMARLCLTSHNGTKTRGLWRGLALKTRDTRFKPAPYFGDIDSLAQAPLPLILMVRLDPKKPHDPRYRTKWGWAPNVPHTVVLFRVTRSGRYIIGDPAAGIEFWERDALETLWHGEALTLVPR